MKRRPRAPYVAPPPSPEDKANLERARAWLTGNGYGHEKVVYLANLIWWARYEAVEAERERVRLEAGEPTPPKPQS